MKQFKLFINNEWVDAKDGKTFISYDPATGEPIAELACASKEDVDKAAAVVFSHFTRVKDAENIDATFELWASKLKCPVYKGYPYGHANDNRALDFRSTAVIKDDVLSFRQDSSL